jgi:hypothetical protein
MPQRYGKMLERTRKGVLQYRETMLQICKNTEKEAVRKNYSLAAKSVGEVPMNFTKLR